MELGFQILLFAEFRGFLVNIFSVGVGILLCCEKPTLNTRPRNSDFRQKAKEGTITSNIKVIAWKEE